MIKNIISVLLPYSEIITLAFPAAILYLFAIGEEGKKSDVERVKSQTYLFPTFGVLFTFCGIWVGLDNFDPNNISDSLPGILEGFKSSFSSSICGMLGGIISNIFIDYNAKLKDGDEIAIAVKNILKNNNKNKEDIVSCLRDGFDVLAKSSEKTTKEHVFANLALSQVRDGVCKLSNPMEGVRECIEKELFNLRTEITSSINTNAEKIGSSIDNNSDRVSSSVDDGMSKIISCIEDNTKVITSSACDNAKVVVSSIEDNIKVVTSSIEDNINEVTSSIEDNTKVVTSSIEDNAKVVISSIDNNTNEVMVGFGNLMEQDRDSVFDAIKDIMEKFDMKISGHLSDTLNSLSESGEKMLEIVTEEHSFYKSMKDDRAEHLVAVKEMSEDSKKASQAFKDLLSSYIKMEKNAGIASESLEEVGRLAHSARTASRDMGSFMDAFSSQFSKVYSEDISKATEQQAEYLVSIVHHILKQIESSSR